MNFSEKYSEQAFHHNIPNGDDTWNFLKSAFKHTNNNTTSGGLNRASLSTINSLHKANWDLSSENTDRHNSLVFDSHHDTFPNLIQEFEESDHRQFKSDITPIRPLVEHDPFNKINYQNHSQLFKPTPKQIDAFKGGQTTFNSNPENTLNFDSFISLLHDEDLSSLNLKLLDPPDPRANPLKQRLDNNNSKNNTNFNTNKLKFDFPTPVNNLSTIALIKRAKTILGIYPLSANQPIPSEDSETLSELFGRLTKRHHNGMQKLSTASKSLFNGTYPDNELLSEILTTFIQLEFGTDYNSSQNDITTYETHSTIATANFGSVKESSDYYSSIDFNNYTPSIQSLSNSINRIESTQQPTNFMNFQTFSDFLQTTENTQIDSDKQSPYNSLNSDYLSQNTNGTKKWGAHDQGKCKPCAFFHNKKKGCKNGTECEFCHHKDHANHTLKQWKKQQQKMLDQNKKAEENMTRSTLSPIEANPLSSYISFFESTSNNPHTNNNLNNLFNSKSEQYTEMIRSISNPLKTSTS